MTEIQATIWKRFSKKQSLERYGIEFVLLLIFIWATQSVDIYWPFVSDAPAQAADLLNRMTPPNVVVAPKPISYIRTTTTLGAPLGAFTSKISGLVTFLASISVTGSLGGGWMGRIVRSSL